MALKKGAMRKVWTEAKEAAAKIGKDKLEEKFIKSFSDDFGPTLDKVEELHAKLVEYKAAWAKAIELCKTYRLKIESASDDQVSSAAGLKLLKALETVKDSLNDAEVKLV